ncbi:MAG: ABC transporter permease subunit [Coprococcus sp.]|nr:ABC transporter permease subunit [Coprococcus sp.]
MSLTLEYKKSKRTGCFPMFAVGGAAAAAFPVLNMAFRSDMYVSLQDSMLQTSVPQNSMLQNSSVRILLEANWQMMAMVNILLAVLGACLLYHAEYADNAMQKMRTLPVKAGRMFTGKFAWIIIMYFITLTVEAAGIMFCIYRWFQFGGEAAAELLQSFGYSLLLALPAISASLLIASLCRNVWISLGIGVVCVFTATMLPTSHFALSLFPFAMPFQILPGTTKTTVYHFMLAAVLETTALSATELIILKIRRLFE